MSSVEPVTSGGRKNSYISIQAWLGPELASTTFPMPARDRNGSENSEDNDRVGKPGTV